VRGTKQLDNDSALTIVEAHRNAALGSCATLTRYPLPAFFRDPAVEAHVVPSIRAVMLEILAVGRAMGFDEEALPFSVVDTTIENTAKLHKAPDSTHRPSMLLDLELGRPLEVEVVVGELVRKAKELRVDVPVCRGCGLFFLVKGRLMCR
jgi:2-dehydropantoate 2-reductase